MQRMIDGVRLAYDDAGSGEVLILLHGFPFDRTIWDSQFEILARHLRVIRIDLRGSGESGCGVGPALMETLAGDVFGLMEALDVERAILAGHSMGGYVALAFFRMYAERVAGLALIASHVGADLPPRRIERDEQAAKVIAYGLEPMAGQILSRSLTPGFAQANPQTLERIRAIVVGQNASGAAAQIIGMKERVDSADLLEDVTVPTTIVGGENDPIVAAATLQGTAAAIDDCELVLLRGVAHLPMLEAAEATTAALERLIARCAVKGRADRHTVPATRV